MINLITQAIENPSLWILLSLAGPILAIIHIPSVLLRRSNPVGQLAWIMCLIALPYVGVLSWWVFGRTRIEKRKRKHAQIRSSFSDPNEAISEEGYQFQTTINNTIQTLVRGTEAYPEILQAINNAKHHVHLEFYIWNNDEVGRQFRDALEKAAKRGVIVRVIVDAVGSDAVLGSFFNELRIAGGKVAIFLPVRIFKRSLRINFRNHRKIVVVDGQIAFTGGLNIGEEYNDWFDAFFRITGPMVHQFQRVFCEDWFFTRGEELVDDIYYSTEGTSAKSDSNIPAIGEVRGRVIASGPDRDIDMIHSVFFIGITQAKDRIYITTPYFIPDDAILAALRTAVMRGVDVRLLLPGKSDVRFAQWASRSYFSDLLKAGVRIFEYQSEILHAKLMVIDEQFSIIGSANMDSRSFRLQFEINMAIDSHAQNQKLAALFIQKQKEGIEIQSLTWSQRSKLTDLGEACARLFSPLL